jgi:hypothetical protein
MAGIMWHSEIHKTDFGRQPSSSIPSRPNRASSNAKLNDRMRKFLEDLIQAFGARIRANCSS